MKPGGRLIYATCSINRGENEDVRAAFLGAHPEFAPAQALPESAGLGTDAPILRLGVKKIERGLNPEPLSGQLKRMSSER